MCRDYILNRIVLSMTCVLVDCTRGLCKDDVNLIRFLIRKG